MITRPQRFQKFLFKADCFALEGTIRKPYFQKLERHVPLQTYAGSPTRAMARNEGFTIHRDISYGAASSEIVATSDNGTIHRTIVEAKLEKFQVRDRLTIASMVARLESRYDSRDYPGRRASRILPTGSSISGIELDGKRIEVRLPPAFELGEGEREAFFSGKFDRDPRFHPGFIPEPVHVEGFGTLYFAEWVWVHPDEREAQNVTMLRLSLGSDFGCDARGASGTSDGSGWP